MGDSKSAGAVWLLFGLLAPVLFALKLPFVRIGLPEGVSIPWYRVAWTAMLESGLPLTSISLSLYLVLIADTSVMPGALDSRVVKFGTFLAILFAANFLADYYVLFGGLDDECYELQRERIHRSLLSGALATCVFPMSWMAVGSLLEAYL